MDAQVKYEVKGKTKAIMDVITAANSDKISERSFYLVDLADIVDKYRMWRAKLPRVDPFYAVKCNSDPQVLRLMVALGIHFDCASKREFEVVLAAGAKPSQIIYAHPYKSRSYLGYAENIGVDCMTFDSESELRKIKEMHPHARLVIRFRVPNVIAAFPLNQKFGCELRECRHLLEVAWQLQLDVIGTCFHVGGLCQEPKAYSRAIRMARQVFDIAREVGYDFTLLDLGGGYPGHVGSYELFSEMSSYINQSLNENFPSDDNLQVIAEPGCYFVCSAFTLCTTILGKKEMTFDNENENDESKVRMMYYMNDGFYMSFPEGIEKYKFQLIPLLSSNEMHRRPLLTSKLWGATCCSSDYIMKKCLLPEMELGEHIIFRNMGAYTLTLSTNFNGFPTPTTKYVYLSRRNVDVPKCLFPYDESTSDYSTSKDKITVVKIASYLTDDDSNSDLCRNG